MSPNAGGGGGGSCGVSANEYCCTQEPKQTLEITPYLTFDPEYVIKLATIDITTVYGISLVLDT